MLSRVKTGIAASAALAVLALGVLPAGASAASGEPFGNTGGVRYVTSTSAQLLGSVAPWSYPTSYKFRYGTSYESVKDCKPANCVETPYVELPNASTLGGGEKAPVGVEIHGLNPDTPYFYEIVVAWVNPTSGSTELKSSTHMAQIKSFLLKGQALHFVVPRTVGAPIGSYPTLRGTLAGLGGGEVGVEVLRQSYPYTGGYETVAKGTTGAIGQFALRLPKLTTNAHYLVATVGLPRNVQSATMTFEAQVKVSVRASVKANAVDRLSGAVTPAVRDAEVEIQAAHRVKSGPHRGEIIWGTIFVTHTNSLGRFSVAGRIPRSGKYRAFVRVDADGLSSGASAALELSGATRHHKRHATRHAHHHKK
jgi:hypothetical protein